MGLFPDCMGIQSEYKRQINWGEKVRTFPDGSRYALHSKPHTSTTEKVYMMTTNNVEYVLMTMARRKRDRTAMVAPGLAVIKADGFAVR